MAWLNGWEVVAVLVVVMILFGAKSLPGFAQGFRRGISEFRDAIDSEASAAGKSFGGIYGQKSGEALTPDNQVAELYDPAVFHHEPQKKRLLESLIRRFAKLCQWIWKRGPGALAMD